MSEEKNFTWKIEEYSGKRLDMAIARLGEFNRSQVQKSISAGKVMLNGEVCIAKNYKLKSGDIVEISLIEKAEISLKPENIPLDIVYEDDDLIIVNKPSGMVVHPAPGSESGTVVNALLYHLGENGLSNINGELRPGIVHRIDKDTSGLIVCAKNNSAHEKLAEQFEAHSIARCYLAIVRDNLKLDSGTIDEPIGRDPKDRKKRCVNGEAPRRAVTHYEVLERFGTATYVRCRLETGRTHQIRVHMAYIKHPLLGDPVYGGRKAKPEKQGQFLHAAELGFIHPSTGEYIHFEKEAPDYFISKLNELRKTK